MERYRRIDVNNESVAESRAMNRPPKFVRAGDTNHYNNYYNNGGASGSSVPPTQYRGGVDSSRQYIPMSQKGTRPINYHNETGNSRAINPALAMKLMYN